MLAISSIALYSQSSDNPSRLVQNTLNPNEQAEIDKKIARIQTLRDSLPEQAEKEAQELLITLNSKNANQDKLIVYDLLFNIQLVKGQSDEAFYYARKEAAVAKRIGDDIAVTNSMINMSNIYKQLGEINRSLEILLQAGAIADTLRNPSLRLLVYNEIADLYYLEKNYDEATKAINRVMSLGDSSDKKLHVDKLNLLSQLEVLIDSTSRAKRLAEQAITQANLLNYRVGIAQAKSNLAKAFFKENNLDDARAALTEALDIYTALNVLTEMFEMNTRLGRIHLRQNDLYGSIKYFKDAYELAQNIDALPIKATANKNLAGLYARIGSHDIAYDFQLEYSAIRDSIFEIEQETGLRNLEQSRSIDFRQEMEEQRLLDDLKIARENRKYDIAKFAGIAILLLGIFGFLFFRYRYKQRIVIKEKRAAYLEKVDAMRDDFLANTSHELRTPLNGIIGIAESMQESVFKDAPDKIASDLNLIATSGKRLADLVNSILDFSKLKSHEIKLHQKPIDPHAIVDVVMQINKHAKAGKSIQLINNIPEEFEAVYADEHRLHQILHNLIGNAIKFTEKGKVTSNAVVKDGFIEFSITDTGIGIPANKLQSVFASFEQIDSSMERAYGGTGLGLSITKSLVELHGGKIWIESKEGEGSTAFFTLPVSSEKATTTAKTTNMPQERVIPQRSVELIKPVFTTATTKRILVVDDEEINKQVIVRYLADEDMELVLVDSGALALEAIKKQVFDMVLLDVMMPKMNGYEVCQEIRKQYLPSDLPIIMLTAKNQVNDLVDSLSYGANDYLAKPFSKSEFLARVKTHMNLHSINQAYVKFVPREFLTVLGKQNIMDVNLGDQEEREMSILFSDIRGYTAISESMTPEENFNFLNAYLSRVGPSIKQHDGFVNDYYGDGIMALFLGKPQNALNAAIDMLNRVRVYNQQRKKLDRMPIEIGVGIHTGNLIMGILGDEFRLNAGVVSDAVNASARLEGLTKIFHAEIILSHALYETIENPQSYDIRYLGMVKVVGKTNTLRIYECFSTEDKDDRALKRETKREFESGLSAYMMKEFDGAAERFQNVLKQNPNDEAASLYMQKCREYMVSPNEDFTGALDISIK